MMTIGGPSDRPPDGDRPPVPYWEPPAAVSPTPPPVPYWEPAPRDQPYGESRRAGTWQQTTPPPPMRPKTVRDGTILACVGAGLIVVSGLFLVTIATNAALFEAIGHELAARFDLTDLDERSLRAALLFSGSVTVVVGMVPIPFAVLAFQGHAWARVVVTVVAGGYVAVTLIGLLAGLGGSVIAAAPLVGAIAAYWRRSSTEWYEAGQRGDAVPTDVPTDMPTAGSSARWGPQLPGGGATPWDYRDYRGYVPGAQGAPYPPHAAYYPPATERQLRLHRELGGLAYRAIVLCAVIALTGAAGGVVFVWLRGALLWFPMLVAVAAGILPLVLVARACRRVTDTDSTGSLDHRGTQAAEQDLLVARTVFRVLAIGYAAVAVTAITQGTPFASYVLLLVVVAAVYAPALLVPLRQLAHARRLIGTAAELTRPSTTFGGTPPPATEQALSPLRLVAVRACGVAALSGVLLLAWCIALTAGMRYWAAPLACLAAGVPLALVARACLRTEREADARTAGTSVAGPTRIGVLTWLTLGVCTAGYLVMAGFGVATELPVYRIQLGVWAVALLVLPAVAAWLLREAHALLSSARGGTG